MENASRKRLSVLITCVWLAMALLFLAVAIPYGVGHPEAQGFLTLLLRIYCCSLFPVVVLLGFLRYRERIPRLLFGVLGGAGFLFSLWISFFL